ncbi:MAG: hypothetical protein QXT97_02485 [Candidatus Diapherotrites archaeon]
MIQHDQNQINKTVNDDDTRNPSLPSVNLEDDLNSIRSQIRKITGKTSWHTEPTINLEETEDSLDDYQTRITAIENVLNGNQQITLRNPIIAPQNNSAGEGGEINLKGTTGTAEWFLEVYNGIARLLPSGGTYNQQTFVTPTYQIRNRTNGWEADIGGQKFFHTTSMGVQWAFVAKLPAETAGTHDRLFIRLEGSLFSFGNSSDLNYLEVVMTRRNGFNHRTKRSYQGASNVVGVRAFQQADGSVDVWIRFPAEFMAFVAYAYHIGATVDNTTEHVRTQIPIGPRVSSTPTGTQIYDSNTATSNRAEVMDYGSNPNGFFMRLGNGVQMCWIRGFNAAHTNTWVFPATFVNVDGIFATYNEVGNIDWIWTISFYSVGTSAVSFKKKYWTGSGGFGDAITEWVSLFAIGRWY